MMSRLPHSAYIANRGDSVIWSTDQEATLREFVFLDAQGTTATICKNHGVRRNPEVTTMHAGRIHVSLIHHLVCPECGCMVGYLNRQIGLCKRCAEFKHVEEWAFNNLLETERVCAEDSLEIEGAKRETLQTLRIEGQARAMILCAREQSQTAK